MDTEKTTNTELQSLISRTRARFRHQEARLQMADKYRAELLLAAQGGTWYVDPGFLASLRGAPQTQVYLDQYDNPRKVDTAELLTEAQALYDRVMNAWFTEWQDLEGRR